MVNPFLYLFTELSSSSEVRHILIPLPLEHVAYYRDAEGYLIPIIAGGFHYIAADDVFIIGLMMNDLIYAIYDIQKRQVVVTVDHSENVLMTEELHAEYDHLFVRLSPPTPPRSHRVAQYYQRRNNPNVINRHPN